MASQTDILDFSVPLIEKGQRDETIKDGNPKAIAIAFWGAIQGIAETIASSPDLPCLDAKWLVDILRRNTI